MKKKLLRLLPFAAVLLTASCMDKQYDLSNINTESRFAAKGLVVPLNMSPIKLDNIISIEENGDIQKDADGNYYFKKVGKEPFKSEDVKVEKITITKPNDISQSVTVTVTLSTTIQNNWNTHAPGMTIKQIKDAGLSSAVGFDDDPEIFSVTINESNTTINLKNPDDKPIDSKITGINKLGLDPLPMNLDIRLGALNNVVNKVNISNLKVALPSGMTIQEADVYTSNTGELKYNDPLEVSVGTPKTIATVTGLDCNAMGTNLFNKSTHKFTYSKECSISGTAKIKVSDLSDNTTLSDITAGATSCTCVVNFSNDLVINSFSGDIEYTLDNDISIDPVDIENLPEILQESGTSIELANPQLYLVNVSNPFVTNNIKPEAVLSITGNNTYKATLKLNKANNNILMSPKYEDLWDNTFPKEEWVKFEGLGGLLSGDKIPTTLTVNVEKPVLNAIGVENFELGKDHPGITGNWKFYTKLALTDKTKISYNKVWDDWGSEDLDGLTVEKATVSFDFKKDVALDAESIEFFLHGKEGKLYGITNNVKGDANVITIEMTGGPVSNITGGELKVKLKGQGKGINTTQQIEVSNLRMTVDGHYDKKF